MKPFAKERRKIMPYNQTSGIITPPVSVNDVKQALGISSDDVATLCRSANVQGWAKFKPVIINPDTPDTVTGQFNFNNNRWGDGSTWWKANDGRSAYASRNGYCGWVIPSFSGTEIADFFNDVIDIHPQGHVDLYPWTRVYPDATCYKRLQDFAGYINKPRAALSLFGPERPVYYTGGALRDYNIVISCSYNIPSLLNGASLSLKDFAGLSTYYFGVFVSLNGTCVGYITTSNRVGDEIGNTHAWAFMPTVTIPCGSNNGLTTTGTYHVAPFFSTGSQTTYRKVTAVPTSGELGTVLSANFKFSEFKLVSSGMWLKIDIIRADSYLSNPITGTVRISTFVTATNSNEISGKENYIRAFELEIWGKYSTGGSDIGYEIVGEPHPKITSSSTNSVTNNGGTISKLSNQSGDLTTLLRIPCSQDGNTAGYRDLNFSLENVSGTGQSEFPVRTLVAKIKLYHNGRNSFDNQSATEEYTSDTARLKETQYSK